MRRLFSLFLAVLVAIGLAGCKVAERVVKVSEEEVIRETVDNSMAVLQNPAEHDTSAYLDEEVSAELASYGADLNEFLAAALKNLSYTINEVTIEDGTAQVAMTISNVNTDEAMKLALDDFDAWTDTDEAVDVFKESGEPGLYDKLFELLYARFDEMGDSVVSTDVTLSMQRLEDGSWDVTETGNEEFYAALYGGATFKF